MPLQWNKKYVPPACDIAGEEEIRNRILKLHKEVSTINAKLARIRNEEHKLMTALGPLVLEQHYREKQMAEMNGKVKRLPFGASCRDKDTSVTMDKLLDALTDEQREELVKYITTI